MVAELQMAMEKQGLDMRVSALVSSEMISSISFLNKAKFVLMISLTLFFDCFRSMTLLGHWRQAATTTKMLSSV